MTEVASIPRLDQLGVGSELPELRKDPITKVQLVKYAGASGDFNLIHTDDETAKRVGLDGVIAHGMLSMAFLGQYCCWLGGPDSVRRLTVRFAEMVRPGDVLTCRGRVKAIVQESSLPPRGGGSGRGGAQFTLEIWAENQRAQRVTTGEAELVIPG